MERETEREREEGEGERERGERGTRDWSCSTRSKPKAMEGKRRKRGKGTASDAGCEILVERHSFVLSLETFNSTGLTLVMGSLSY